MLLRDLVLVSRNVTATMSRLKKINLLGDFLGRLAPEEIEIGARWLSGELRQGKIGVGYATLREGFSGMASERPRASLVEVDQYLDRVAETT